MRWRLPNTVLTVSILAFLAYACADSTSPVEVDDRSEILVKVIGPSSFLGLPGEEISEPLRVKAVTVDGTKELPVVGVIVNFVVTSGGGSMYAGAAATDKDGIAADYLTLGPELYAENRVEVRSVDSDGTKHIWGGFYFEAVDEVDPPDVWFDLCTPDHSQTPGHPVPGGDCASTYTANPGDEVLIWADAYDDNDPDWEYLRVGSESVGVHPWSEPFDGFINGWAVFVVPPDWKGSYPVTLAARDRFGTVGVAVGELIVVKTK